MQTSIILGVMSAFSMSPFLVFPILIFSLAKIFTTLLQSHYNIKHKLIKTYLFFFTFNLVSMHWLYKPFLITNMYVLAMPLLLLLLALYLSIFHFVASCLFVFFYTRSRLSSIILFAFIFTFAEFVMGILFGGIPWNLAGYSLSFSHYTLQSAYYIKIYGLSFLVYLTAGFTGMFLNTKEIKFLVAAFSVFVGNLIFGIIRIHSEDYKFSLPVDIKIIQTNLDQKDKWTPELAYNHLNHCITLSKPSKKVRTTASKPLIIIWPETAIPFAISEDHSICTLISNVISKEYNTAPYLVSGIVYKDFYNHFNSMAFIDINGFLSGLYHKFHLTPFGEYIPFRSIPIINMITNDFRDYSPGTDEQNIRIKNTISFKPLICYDAIFPMAHSTADFIINISNDAWFSGTVGKYQHFEISRLRAIESGVPLIRCSNTGISAIIDKFGRIIKSSKPDVECIIDFSSDS